jgi:hypothetical protein
MKELKASVKFTSNGFLVEALKEITENVEGLADDQHVSGFGTNGGDGQRFSFIVKEKVEEEEPEKPTASFNPHQGVDEDALQKTLEGIPEPDQYYEVVYATSKGLPSSITSSLFPAVRILLETSTYTIARIYIGNIISSEEQLDVLMPKRELTPFREPSDDFIALKRVV